MNNLFYEKTNDKEENYKLLKLLLPYISTFLAIFLGAFITQYASDRSYEKQHNKELKEECYAKLSSIKGILVQSMKIYTQSLIFADYYKARYYKLSEDTIYYNLGYEEHLQSRKFLPEVTQNQKDLQEVLAKIRIAFRSNEKLIPLLDTLNKNYAIDVDGSWTEKNIPSLLVLDSLEKAAEDYSMKLINDYYTKNIDEILIILLQDLKNEN
ncbi:MAG: hypothetical protein IPM38_05700 [Ignavibacteria bacterium]|nr:hypothetical protein [Ignavibacteria bacterium]